MRALTNELAIPDPIARVGRDDWLRSGGIAETAALAHEFDLAQAGSAA